MKTIYKYELKRLLLNRFFLRLYAVLLLYCLQLLNTDIIAGVAYTAPSSGRSFGFYFAGILPILLTALLFLLTFQSSPAELKVSALTCNTPTDPWRHRLIQLAAAGTGCLIPPTCWERASSPNIRSVCIQRNLPLPSPPQLPQASCCTQVSEQPFYGYLSGEPATASHTDTFRWCLFPTVTYY